MGEVGEVSWKWRRKEPYKSQNAIKSIQDHLQESNCHIPYAEEESSERMRIRLFPYLIPL